MMHHDNLDAAFFALLAAAGVDGVNFGTESTNARFLQLMRKQAEPDVIARNLRDAHAAGISVISNAIADYPTITFEEAVAVVRDFEELSPHIDVLNPSLFDLTAGTPAAADPACHRLDVPANAYQRTSHGFHSLGFVRDAELTQEQRLVLRAAYDRPAAAIRLRRRVEAVFAAPVIDNDVVILDRGAFVVSGKGPSLRIPALSMSVELVSGELQVVSRLLAAGSRSTIGKLRSLGASIDYEGDWAARLMHAGIVKAVTRPSRVREYPCVDRGRTAAATIAAER